MIVVIENGRLRSPFLFILEHSEKTLRKYLRVRNMPYYEREYK